MRGYRNISDNCLRGECSMCFFRNVRVNGGDYTDTRDIFMVMMMILITKFTMA